MDSDGKLLFDARTGRVDGTDDNFLAPSAPAQGRIFSSSFTTTATACPGWDFPVYVK